MYNLSKRAKLVSIKKMNFWERLYFPAILSGIAVTISHLLRKKTTISYPEQTRTFAKVYRGQHVLKRDNEGRERCTACGLCAVSCPAEAITMVAAERKKEEKELYREEKYASVYEINMLRCIFCGLCEEACPKEAIFLTDRIVNAGGLRENFIYGKEKLLEPKPLEKRIDVSQRQTPEVLAFKTISNYHHNK